MQYESRLEIDISRLVFDELFHFQYEFVRILFGGSHPEIQIDSVFSFVSKVGYHRDSLIRVLFYEFCDVVVYLGGYLQNRNMSQICLFVMQSVIYVSFYNSHVCTGLCQILRFDGFQTFLIICKQENIFVFILWNCL